MAQESLISHIPPDNKRILFYINEQEADYIIIDKKKIEYPFKDDQYSETVSKLYQNPNYDLSRDKRKPETLDYVSSPLKRASETMEAVRAAIGLPAQDYRSDERLAEIAFGAWEGFTIAQLHERDPARIAQREHDKWHFVPPGGESYEMVAARMRAWYAGLARDTVVTAHGGTARGLIADLGIAKPAAAPLLDIEQGMVYVFEGETLTRYS